MPQVVTCILENEGKLLLLKRSNLVRTYRGLWGGVAGYVEELEDPYDTAIKEIQEEAGIGVNNFKLVRKGDPIEVSDTYQGKRYDWVVYPFLFHIENKGLIRIDWEHEDYQWIYSSEVRKLDTVPGLEKIITQLLDTPDVL